MSKRNNRRGNQPSANRGIPTAPSADPLTDISGEVDAVRSFMTKNPKDSFPADTSDDVIGTLSTPVDDAAPEPLGTDAVDSQGEPIAAAPVVDAAAPAAPLEGDKPAGEATATAAPDAKPVEGAAPVAAPVAAAPAATVEPAKPSYAADEKIFLIDGSDPWTREQVVAGLQERAVLQPKAKEADDFRTLFGYDYAKAQEQWKPILDTLRADPDKTNFLDAAIKADPELVAYLKASLEFYQSETAKNGGAPAAAATAGAQPSLAQPPSQDPEMVEMRRFYAKQKEQAGIDRANREWNTVFDKYPFFRTDAKSLEGLKATANVLYELDRKAGKDDLECRGLLDALTLNQSIYDAIAIARSAQAAPVIAPTLPSVDPMKGPEALLGSPGPAPSGVARQKVSDYTGNPDDAVAAFVQQFPGR